MDKTKTMDGYAQFAELLAPLLSEQLRGGAALTGELLTQAPSAPETSEHEGALALTLRFEGALAGEGCFLVSADDAARLAGDDGDSRGALRSAIASTAEPFATALFTHYGSVHVQAGEGSNLPEGSAPIAVLTGVAGDGSPISITLYADGELQRGLPRLARIAAAAEASGITGGNLGLVMDVELNVTLRFGQRQLSLREVMDLASGSVVELDREVDEPVELILDGRVIARGEAVIVDGNYGVRVTEVLQPMVA